MNIKIFKLGSFYGDVSIDGVYSRFKYYVFPYRELEILIREWKDKILSIDNEKENDNKNSKMVKVVDLVSEFFEKLKEFIDKRVFEVEGIVKHVSTIDSNQVLLFILVKRGNNKYEMFLVKSTLVMDTLPYIKQILEDEYYYKGILLFKNEAELHKFIIKEIFEQIAEKLR